MGCGVWVWVRVRVGAWVGVRAGGSSLMVHHEMIELVHRVAELGRVGVGIKQV